MHAEDVIEREVRYAFAYCEQVLQFSPKTSVEQLINDFTSFSSATRPLLPEERAVVAMLKPKTAALLGERIWLQYPGADSRLNFAFGWESATSIRLAALIAFMRSVNFLRIDEPNGGTISREALSPHSNEFIAITEAELVKDYSNLTGALVTPFYASMQARDTDYKSGTHAVVLSVIEQVAVVAEDDLTWEQVIEFRNDKAARVAYRRFIHWLDREMLGKPASFVVDEVNERLERYTWALRRHGLGLVVGALERTLDLKSLLGGAAAAMTLDTITRLPILSILGGAGVAVGNAAIRVATHFIEREEILAKNGEVAFVHQLKGSLGAKPGTL